jgi:hypothetical protein
LALRKLLKRVHDLAPQIPLIQIGRSIYCPEKLSEEMLGSSKGDFTQKGFHATSAKNTKGAMKDLE